METTMEIPTGTPSYLPPPSLKTRLRYDVFLSFRGEDTREKFTLKLHDALTLAGVRAFIDNEGLERGDDISPALLEGIEDSAAAVAILSPRYADSWWCLEELSGIFDRRRRVLPVFYRVDPSDVRKQRGPFEADFARYEREERFIGKVERWRECMHRVGNLAGYVVVESKESLAIQLIVKKILEILSNTPEHVADFAVGLDPRAETVLRILHSQPRARGVRVLGIHGTPGIGKTTLAKAVFNKLVASFEHRSFVSNVNDILAKEGPCSVQRKIICDLSGQAATDDNVEVNVESIALEFRQVIHERRVVVVLDDVSGEDQLSSLCIERDRVHEGSVFIITSRNREVLQHFAPNVELHEARKLDTSESLELFSYHALRRKKPTDNFLDISKKIVPLTGGLPLALQVFGSFLLDKRTREEWEESLQKLEQIRPSRLQDVLQISFDALDDEEKCIFLDISCLLIQMKMKMEEVVDIFEGCGFKAKVAIGQLVKKSLLKINEDGTLWMHDQIRDMGRQIVFHESLDDLGMRSRLWDVNDIVTVLSDKTNPRKATRGLVLDIENKELKKDLSADIISQLQFQREPNLRTAMVCLKEKIRARFLSLSDSDHMILSTTSFEQMPLLKLLQINYLKLQGDFKYMPAELRWLKWQGCSYKSLPSNLPRQIRVLDLSASKIECLLDRNWTFRGSNEIAQNLTVLNLRGCCRITTLPDLSPQRNLKKLILENCRKLTMIHESIGHMSSLIHLNMRDCSSLIQFPSNVDGLKCLKELVLSGCSKLKELPEDIRSLKSLQQLLLDNTAISKLPGYVHCLTNLELLSLTCCSQLKCICIGELVSLKELRLDHSAVEKLPNSVRSLTSLEKLSLRGCRSLTDIPDSLGELESLEELFLGGSSVNSLPHSIRSLLYLRVLSVSLCRSLTTLPLSVKGLRSLNKLDLDETLISHLPEDIGFLKAIKELSMRKCSKLESLPVSIRSLLCLEKLVLEGSTIKELPESIGKLESLSWLNLNKCKSLSKLPDSIGHLTSLSNLLMEETGVTRLPECFGGLLSLKVLKMKSDKEQSGLVAALPTSFSDLSRLEEFDARACSISGQIPDDFQRLSSLQVLNLEDNSFHSLPSSLVGLVFLKKLTLRNCKMLKSLPPLPSSLLELNAADCTALAVVSDLSNLESLHELVLSNCERLLDVPGLERLKSLRRLFMVGCSAAASAVRQRMSKDCLKKLNYLSIPGGEMPEWFSEEVTFSSRESLSLKGLLIAVVVSVDRTSLEAIKARSKLPAIVDIQAKIMRLNEPIHTKTLYLEGVPSTSEDQLYLCRFLDYHALVFMLRDGDKLEVSVRSPGSCFIELKRCGIHLIYENDDDYDGDEEALDECVLSVSERLARFFRSLGQ